MRRKKAEQNGDKSESTRMEAERIVRVRGREAWMQELKTEVKTRLRGLGMIVEWVKILDKPQHRNIGYAIIDVDEHLSLSVFLKTDLCKELQKKKKFNKDVN